MPESKRPLDPPSPEGGFPTTVWTHIHSARLGSAGGLTRLLVRYRGPIVSFIRRKGFREDQAEDLAQEVLLRVSRPGFFDEVEPVRGRFRSLLQAVTRHVISEQLRHDRAAKRGGAGRVVLASQLPDSANDLYDRPREREDALFDQVWVRELVESALGELERHFQERGTLQAAAFRLKYVDGRSQEEVAQKLGCTVFQAKNYIHSGKHKFKEFMLRAIREYCASPEEYEEETRRLAPYLRNPPP
jgi:RNA polymerase sigma-70 factor (ECF subfamily)